MAQSFIKWESPILDDFDNVAQMSAFINDLDSKLVESGLIKIESESKSYTKPTPNPVPTTGVAYRLATLCYKFPKGQAKVEYEDVVGKNYKKIKRASYYKTDTQIKLDFLFIHATSASVPLDDVKFFSKKCFMICDLMTRNTSNIDWKTCSNMGSYYTWGTSAIMPSSGNNSIDRNNYISHTEDSFNILFGVIKYPEIVNVYDSRQALITFSLKRSKDYNSHSIIYPTSSRMSNGNMTGTVYDIATCRDDSYNTYRHDRITNIFNWQNPFSDSNIEGELVIYPTLALHGGVKEMNHSLYITKTLPNGVSINEDNAVVSYNGVPVMISTLFVGNYSKAYTLYMEFNNTSTASSFMFIKPNHQVITGDLI